MCGVVAIRSWGAPVAAGDVDRALDAMASRGPDGRGAWRSVDGRAILGHVRLAVQDLAGGAQPIANEDGRVVAAVNGELYGAAELRGALEARGHSFRTKSDSELVVHGWEEWGRDMLLRLRGEVAFALWDDRLGVLVAARDRFGVKPLAWAERDACVLVASRASALLALGVRPVWDEASLMACASFQYAPPDATLFAGIHELPAGHLLFADRGKVSIERYWDLDYPRAPTPVSDEREAARVLGSLFDDAVAERLIADVPVAFQLSGGLDSSAVLASAARGQPLDAFTVSFTDDAAYDELHLAEATARALGARLHVVRVGDREVAQAFPEAVVHAESVCINGHAAAKLLLCRAIRDSGFKVVLTGEGADETLFGYAHLRSDLDGASARLHSTNAASAGLMLPDTPGLSTRGVESVLGFVPTWIAAKASMGKRLRGLLRPALAGCTADHDAGHALVAGFDVRGQLAGRGRVEQSAYLWTRLALEGYILRALGDGLEMASSVEGRVPFLDHVLFEWVRGLPTDMKIRSGAEKWTLREAMRGRVPDAVTAREKHPFLGPPMGPATLDIARDAFASRSFEDQPLFEPKRVRTLAGEVPRMSPAERKAHDPVLHFALSIAVLQARLGMAS